MLAKLRTWLFDAGGPEMLPDACARRSASNRSAGEILIAWCSFAILGLLATTTIDLNAGWRGAVTRTRDGDPGHYGVFSLVRLALAHRRLMRHGCSMFSGAPRPPWQLLMALIFSFHLKYAQPGGFLPQSAVAALCVSVHRVAHLRFEGALVLFTGFTASSAGSCSCTTSPRLWRTENRTPTTSSTT